MNQELGTSLFLYFSTLISNSSPENNPIEKSFFNLILIPDNSIIKMIDFFFETHEILPILASKIGNYFHFQEETLKILMEQHNQNMTENEFFYYALCYIIFTWSLESTKNDKDLSISSLSIITLLCHIKDPKKHKPMISAFSQLFFKACLLCNSIKWDIVFIKSIFSFINQNFLPFDFFPTLYEVFQTIMKHSTHDIFFYLKCAISNMINSGLEVIIPNDFSVLTHLLSPYIEAFDPSCFLIVSCLSEKYYLENSIIDLYVMLANSFFVHFFQSLSKSKDLIVIHKKDQNESKNKGNNNDNDSNNDSKELIDFVSNYNQIDSYSSRMNGKTVYFHFLTSFSNLAFLRNSKLYDFDNNSDQVENYLTYLHSDDSHHMLI